MDLNVLLLPLKHQSYLGQQKQKVFLLVFFLLFIIFLVWFSIFYHDDFLCDSFRLQCFQSPLFRQFQQFFLLPMAIFWEKVQHFFQFHFVKVLQHLIFQPFLGFRYQLQMQITFQGFVWLVFIQGLIQLLRFLFILLHFFQLKLFIQLFKFFFQKLAT